MRLTFEFVLAAGARDRLAETEAELAASHEDGLRLAAQAASADFELADVRDALAEAHNLLVQFPRKSQKSVLAKKMSKRSCCAFYRGSRKCGHPPDIFVSKPAALNA